MEWSQFHQNILPMSPNMLTFWPSGPHQSIDLVLWSMCVCDLCTLWYKILELLRLWLSTAKQNTGRVHHQDLMSDTIYKCNASMRRNNRCWTFSVKVAWEGMKRHRSKFNYLTGQCEERKLISWQTPSAFVSSVLLKSVTILVINKAPLYLIIRKEMETKVN